MREDALTIALYVRTDVGDVWRRVMSDWLAGLVTTGVVDDENAREMAWDLAYGQAKSTYHLGELP